MEVADFTNEVEEAFICGICRGVMIKPVCCKDGHSWCHECITQWLDKNPICPEGGNKLLLADLTTLRPIEQVLLSIIILKHKTHV